VSQSFRVPIVCVVIVVIVPISFVPWLRDWWYC